VKRLDVVGHDVPVPRQYIHRSDFIAGHEKAVARNIGTENGPESSSGSLHGNCSNIGMLLKRPTVQPDGNPWPFITIIFIINVLQFIIIVGPPIVKGNLSPKGLNQEIPDYLQ
jgi:hypothetical protein